MVDEYLLELEQERARREAEGIENKNWFNYGAVF